MIRRLRSLKKIANDLLAFCKVVSIPIRYRDALERALAAGRLPSFADQKAVSEWSKLSAKVHRPAYLGLGCVADLGECPFCLALGTDTVPNPNRHLKISLYNKQTRRYEVRLFPVFSPVGRLIALVESPSAFSINERGQFDVDFKQLNPNSAFGQWLNLERTN